MVFLWILLGSGEVDSLSLMGGFLSQELLWAWGQENFNVEPSPAAGLLLRGEYVPQTCKYSLCIHRWQAIQ